MVPPHKMLITFTRLTVIYGKPILSTIRLVLELAGTGEAFAAALSGCGWFKNLQQKAIISSGEYNIQSGIFMSAVEQYVVDENGNKVAVILPLAEYQHLKEDLHDLAMVAERRDEGTISLAELKKRVM